MRFYGFLSNSYTSALVSSCGSVDWFPAPRFDSGSVFSRLLDDRRGGFCQLSPPDPFESCQRYLPGTNILVTTFTTTQGRGEVTDYLRIGSPELHRLVDSAIPMQLQLQPAFAYGRIPALMEAADPQSNWLWVFRNPRGNDALLLTFQSQDNPTRLSQDTWLFPPGHHEIVLRYSSRLSLEERQGRDPGLATGSGLELQVKYWRHMASFPYAGPHREAVERSILVLMGLTFRPTGAIIAAPTTSLPEILGEGRQWDYRYAWLRDGSYAAEALMGAGKVEAARRFIEFALNLACPDGVPFSNPFFRIDGTVILGERELPWLSGYRSSVPVRVGNAATAQNQMDVEGTLLWMLERYVKGTGDTPFLREYWWAVEAIVTWVEQNGHSPGASLWEFRGVERHYTHSQMMVWVALRSGAKLAVLCGFTDRAARWEAVAKQTAERIWQKGYSSSLGRFQQGYESPALDASLLTLPLYGFVAVDDPRFLTTLEAIERELAQGPFVHRYAADSMGEARHPFLLASFWLARVYLRLGRPDKAEAIVASVLQDAATDLGLMSEHYDIERKEPRGNFPQAFPHAALVLTLLELAQKP